MGNFVSCDSFFILYSSMIKADKADEFLKFF